MAMGSGEPSSPPVAIVPPDRSLGHALAVDVSAEVDFVVARLRALIGGELRRRGAVVAVSGGIDSAVCLGLAVRAFGPDRVLALSLPERESSREGAWRAAQAAVRFGVALTTFDITASLEALGCYRMRDEAIGEVFPDYGAGWKSKLAIAGGMSGGLNFFKLVVRTPDGRTLEERLPHRPYLQIVAAQNYKQRVRKAVEYHHADRLHYAVVGTPNRLEYDQGFFVRNGDGAADVKPIAHLYKTQVYALGRALGVPEDICQSRPSTDTYSLEQGQDEFYFALPYQKMDLALWALNQGVSAGILAPALGLSREQAALVYRDIQAKREATRGLHARPLLVRPVDEIRT